MLLPFENNHNKNCLYFYAAAFDILFWYGASTTITIIMFFAFKYISKSDFVDLCDCGRQKDIWNFTLLYSDDACMRCVGGRNLKQLNQLENSAQTLE